MKVYTRVVIDLETGITVEEDYYWYNGELTLCGGGSGSSGGGGGSGKVDYPTYMKTQHEAWMDDLDTLIGAVSNPFTGLSAYDPDDDLDAAYTAICAFDSVVDALSYTSDWQTAIAAAKSYLDASIFETITLDVPTPAAEAQIDADVVAFGDEFDEQIETTVLPRFKLGYRNAGAIQSSAFVIGQAIIEASRDIQIAKHASGLRIAAYVQADKILADNINLVNDLNTKIELTRREMILSSTDVLLRSMLQRVSFEKDVATLTTDYERIKIVAKSEESKENISLDENEARFPLDVYHYGGNMLAAIGGGTTSPSVRQPSQMQSALGGALSGAIAGATLGSFSANPAGPLIGGAIGAGAGLLMSLMR